MSNDPADPSRLPSGEPCTIGGQQITVLTEPFQVAFSLFQPGLAFCGLTPGARRFFESKVAAPFDSNRQQKYSSYNQLSHGMCIQTVADAQQYRATIWERVAAYADSTLATVRANDAQNAERWYNAAIDLSQMRDNLGSKGKAASRFLQVAENGRPHYDHRELTSLYFKFMDVVTEGTHNGFRVSTNSRHQKQVRRKRYNQRMTAQARLEDALQAIRNEKGIFGDLLGVEGDGNLIEFAYNPRAYADIKNEDRRANLNRTLDKDERKKPNAPDSFPWSEQPAARRSACVYPAWVSLPLTERITTPAAAQAFFQSTNVLSPVSRPDPTLDYFWQHLNDFVRLLYDSVVSSCGMQDNTNTTQAKAFAGAAPEFDTGCYECETRNIQAWCYLVCEMLASGAAYGFLIPRADGQTPIESARHTQCTLSQVFYGESGGDVTVFQRFGAIQMALVCSKAIANPFRGEVEDFLRLRELVWEPLAYLETKFQHRKSNNKRKAPGGPRNDGTNDGGDDARRAGDNGAGSTSGATGNQVSGLPDYPEDNFTIQPPQKRARFGRDDSNMAQAEVQPHMIPPNANIPMDGMGPGPSGSGMQPAPSLPVVNTNNWAPHLRNDQAAASPYPAVNTHSEAQPYNGMPTSQPGMGPSSVDDPFLELYFSQLRVGNAGNFQVPPATPWIQGQIPASETQNPHLPNIPAAQTSIPASAPQNYSNIDPAQLHEPNAPMPDSEDATDACLDELFEEPQDHANVPAPDNANIPAPDNANIRLAPGTANIRLVPGTANIILGRPDNAKIPVPDNANIPVPDNVPESSSSENASSPRVLSEAEYVNWMYNGPSGRGWAREKTPWRPRSEKSSAKKAAGGTAAGQGDTGNNGAGPSGHEAAPAAANTDAAQAADPPAAAPEHHDQPNPQTAGDNAVQQPDRPTQEEPPADPPTRTTLPGDYDWGPAPAFVLDEPEMDVQTQAELFALYNNGAFERPAVPEGEPLAGGSMSGAANTVSPPSFPEVVAAAQGQQQEPGDGADEDAEYEYDDLFEEEASTAAGASTGAGTPANGFQTPATEYSDADSNFK